MTVARFSPESETQVISVYGRCRGKDQERSYSVGVTAFWEKNRA